MKSLAHPDWPYTGTPHEWRGFAEVKEQKLCFVHCGERCNCEIGMNWELSPETKEAIAEIDENIRQAAVYQKQNFGPELT